MDINLMMREAKKMQDEIEKRQKKLDKTEFKVEKHGVVITFTGNRQIKSIKINEALIDPEDPETLEDLLIVAFNEVTEIVNQADEELKPKSAPGMPF